MTRFYYPPVCVTFKIQEAIFIFLLIYLNTISKGVKYLKDEGKNMIKTFKTEIELLNRIIKYILNFVYISGENTKINIITID